MSSNVGAMIRELRFRAGFTQKTLAEALHITDKAISKWERGISLPDVTLLPRLALLLDTDVDVFVSGSLQQEKWAGLISISGCDYAQPVYDKPLVYYLLSHYLLLGISRIYILTDDRNQRYLTDAGFGRFGLELCFSMPQDEHLMIIDQPWFLFGSDLTRQFQGAMISGRNTKLVPVNQEPVVYFAQHKDAYFADRKRFVKTAFQRTLGRGMICLKMDSRDRLMDAASFVRIYQQNAGLLIAGLEDIAEGKNSKPKVD